MPDRRPGLRVHVGPAAGGQHQRVAGQQPADHPPLPVAERRLAVAREDVGQAGLDAHTDESQQPFLAPRSVGVELLLAQRDSDLVVRVGRVWPTQVHGHVEIVRTGPEAGLEDLLVETWVASVDDDVGLGSRDERDEFVDRASVDLRRREAARIVEFTHRLLCGSQRDVGNREGIEEGACFSDGGHRGSNAASADHQDVHEKSVQCGERCEP